jgi:hypothetical protein
VLSELTALATRLGVGVRMEPFGKGILKGRGGLCYLDGKPLVVMDEKLGVEERIVLLAEALGLGGFDVDGAHPPPEVRLTIQQATRRRKRAARGKKKRHPGLARARPR